MVADVQAATRMVEKLHQRATTQLLPIQRLHRAVALVKIRLLQPTIVQAEHATTRQLALIRHALRASALRTEAIVTAAAHAQVHVATQAISQALRAVALAATPASAQAAAVAHVAAAHAQAAVVVDATK